MFDCINQDVPLFQFIFYGATLLVLFLLLIFTENNYVIVFFFFLVGILTMIDIPTPNYLSAGIVFLAFSIRIAKYNLIYSFAVYFATVLTVVGVHVYRAVSPADAVNVLVAYAVIYLVDYFLYNERRG